MKVYSTSYIMVMKVRLRMGFLMLILLAPQNAYCIWQLFTGESETNLYSLNLK